MKVDLSSILKRSINHSFSEVDGEIIMLNIEKGSYFTLNKVGSEIWKMLDKPNVVSDIIDQLQINYEIEKSECENDTMPYLEELVENGLVEVIDEKNKESF
ncbi:MAG: lasso peptide biosynthesis PqqD family chaperone [Bacteroidota bacterium]